MYTSDVPKRFEKVILDDDVPCPRCNARGQKHVKEERGNILIINFSCPKCKLHKFVGFTTRSAIELEDEQTKVEILLDRSDLSIYDRARLNAKLRRVKARKNATQLGLGGS